MRLEELLKGVSVIGEIPDLEINGITCDSREVRDGYLFAAIPGELTDGHRYTASAVEKGAAVILAEHPTDCGGRELYAPSTRSAYQQICANFFRNPQEDLHFLGVTGTNGKTSTSQFVKSILDGLGETAGLIGTVHNQIGAETFPASFTTPEPYQLFALLAKMRDAGVKTVVMEVSSQAMDQRRVDSLHFSAAGFTNLTQDHLDYHKTMENYKEAKARLFSLAEHAICNLDDSCGEEFAERFGGLTYSSENPDADLYASEIQVGVDGVTYQLHYQDECRAIHVSTPGFFTVHNTLCAAGLLLADGLPFAQVADGLNQIPKVPGRAEVITTDESFTVMLDYAHTPDALENILSTIKCFAKGRIITLFGCGGDRDRTKRPLMAKAVAKYSDYIIITSDNPRSEDPQGILADIVVGMEGSKVPYEVIESRREAIGAAVLGAKENDIVLLAGKGHEDYQILKTGKVRFDEKEIVKEFLARR